MNFWVVCYLGILMLQLTAYKPAPLQEIDVDAAMATIRSLSSKTEQLIDKRILGNDVASGDITNLSFSDHR